MQNLVQKIISKLKKDKYQFDQKIGFWDLLSITNERFFQLVRGLFARIFLSRCGNPLFLGRGVKIRSKRHVRFGQSVIIEDHSILSAFSNNGISIGNNVTIGKFAVLQCTGVIRNPGVGIEIGHNSSVGTMSFLGGQGGIKIGNDVIMGPRVNIFSENHRYDDSEVVIRKQGETRKGVLIEDNCWIGANVTILDGVTIRKGCVIAAGAVVTESHQENSVIGGVPAKVIKSRC